MKIIGVTGGIGAGKSIVAKLFEVFGVPVYDSDKEAKLIVNLNKELKLQIIDLLGEESYVDGVYNARFVASKVFFDASLMSGLNAIIHPYVKQDFRSWCLSTGKDLVLKETAILFQANLHKSVDYSVLVVANDDIRMDRIQSRDPQRSKEEIEAIMQKQGDQNAFVELADFVIYNNDKESLVMQVREILNKIER